METLRATVRGLALLTWTCASFAGWVMTRPLGWLSPALGERAHHAVTSAWGKGCMRVMGIRLAIEGEPPAPPFFLVSNHLSYVDIPLMLTVVDGFFLAKSEVASWPLMGYFARATGTMFVDREKKTDIPRVIEQILGVMDRGHGVMLFPEGTSTRGARVHPFRASLFEVPARAQLPVHTAAIHYSIPGEGGPGADMAVCWWGDMTFLGHVWKLLTVPRVDACLRFGRDPVAAPDRKTLAASAQRAVEMCFTPVVV